MSVIIDQTQITSALVRLDLGAGQRLCNHEGFTAVDINPLANPDVVCDLSKAPWPWANESVDEAVSVHFLEHLDGFERMVFFNELWRVLKVGAKCKIQVPYYASMRAVQDPTHKWPPIAETSFLYVNREWRKVNKLDHYPLTCDFDFGYGYIMDQGEPRHAQERNDDTKRTWVRNYWNIVADIEVTLIKRP